MKRFKMPDSIESFYKPSSQVFRDKWRQFHPFIIKGVVDQWSASKKWSKEYLNQQCGDKIVEVECLDYKNHKPVEENYYQYEKMRFCEYTDLAENAWEKQKKQYYLAQLSFEENFPELINDIDYPNYITGSRNVGFWYGFAAKKYQTTSHLHFDNAHNLFAQIKGNKKIILYPPGNYLSFYPPLDSTSSHKSFSRVDPTKYDPNNFPKFPWEKKLEVVLTAGDMLYIPPYWWHYVSALDTNISLSLWYDLKMIDFFRQNKLLSVFYNFKKGNIFN